MDTGGAKPGRPMGFLIMLTMSLVYTALYDRAERAQS